jgi:hypothetical protein
MARKCFPSESSEKLSEVGLRLARICLFFLGTEFIVLVINPLILALDQALRVRKEKHTLNQYAWDKVKIKNYVVNDRLRDLKDAARIYDRSHIDAPATPILFEDENLSDLEKRGFDEIVKIEPIPVRIERLGSEHVLYSHKAIIENAISAVRTALDEHEISLKEYQQSWASERIAREDFCKAFNDLILDSTKKFGRKITDRIFSVNDKPKKKDEPDTSPTS